MSTILPTILIIEKDQATLELYCRELNRDFEVLVCPGKNEALQAIQGQNVNAIVLEPAAWNGQGWDLLDNILTLPAEARSFPIILCSVLDERKRGLEMGAAAFLIKPVLPSQLLETLHQVLETTESTK